MKQGDHGRHKWAWFDEPLGFGFQLGLEIESVVFRETTEYQDLVVYETAQWGRVMALDGIMQVCERDEFIYHEMLTHVPTLAHGHAREICVIGGGDGGILREALKHPIDRVTMVEIDAAVMAICAKYLPSISSGAFDDPRADIVISDGAKFIADTNRLFDVIIVDSTDPRGPGEILFTSEFYADCKTCLTDGGVIVTQSGVTMIQGDELTRTVRRLDEHFVDASTYIAPVPTYAGGFMAFGWGSDNPTVRELHVERLTDRYNKTNISTRYYNPQIHVGAFALPTYIANHLEAAR
ncbi:MAG: spermidine synthase [Alphaproteobacteria bacterium]|nr:spermidine synthase [Alphaproteobacteria bacterium]